MLKEIMAHNTVARLKRLQAEALAFWKEEGVRTGGHAQSRFWRFAHFWLMVLRSFQHNRGPVRASALAYTTLLALIPMLAVAVSITTTFLKNDTARTNELVDKLVRYVAPQLNLLTQVDEEEAALNRGIVVQRMLGFINNVDSGKLGVTAVIALIFVAISLLATIEATFNDIWGVSRGRTWLSRTIHYWAALTLGPLLIVTAVGFQTSPYIAWTKDFIGDNEALRYVFSRLLPLLLLIIVFTVLYRQIPNTKVRWRAALVGGAVGACLWQLNNMSSALYLSRVVTYSKIYGSIGAIPIFLVGLYFSWLILLLGAQVAYAWQNREAYAQEKQTERVNERGREFVALRLMASIARRFMNGERPAARIDLAKELAIPSHLACLLLGQLVQARLVVEVIGEETAYAPAKPLDQITAAQVLDALRVGAGEELETKDDPSRVVVRREFERILLAESSVAHHLTMQALARELTQTPPPKS
jgi:membrane protein